MKKVVAFLLALIIFVAPVTTFVKADVVIGDNDDIVINENAIILGRKLAMLESLSELALSGVTEYTISNTEDVDSYLDSLWSEINDAIDYLESGDWVGDIPDRIASKYYTNLVNYKDVVNNRGEFLGFDLQNPTTSLLKTYFANDVYGKKYTSTNLYSSLDTFRALSDVRGDNIPNPDPDFSFIQNINYLYIVDKEYITNFSQYIPYQYNQNNTDILFDNKSYYLIDNQPLLHNPNTITVATNVIPLTDYLTIYYDTTTNTATYLGGTHGYSKLFRVRNNNFSPDCNTIGLSWSNYTINGNRVPLWEIIGYSTNQFDFRESFDSLSVAINYFYGHFCNINLYVDGVPWSIVNNSSKPTLDVDGYIKVYGNDIPQQYQLQPNTQIDYNQLYQVIYNAIRDNLPISQGDINYYDSHDTIYSPTIINNYGEEEGEESDLIDTILDYAVIPKFDTAIAQPMRAALTNGVVIMNNSITNVIPNEILIILGACFFLLLFAVVINRMIK